MTKHSSSAPRIGSRNFIDSPGLRSLTRATLKRDAASDFPRRDRDPVSALGDEDFQASVFSAERVRLPEFYKARSICKRRDSMDKPRIRPVEAFPIEQQEQTYICLRDPTGLAPEPILLGMGAYFIITLFDGRNDVRDIQGAFVKRFGENLPADKLDDLIATLDKAYFLDSPRLAQRVAGSARISLQPDRPAVHAGACYAKDPRL